MFGLFCFFLYFSYFDHFSDYSMKDETYIFMNEKRTKQNKNCVSINGDLISRYAIHTHTRTNREEANIKWNAPSKRCEKQFDSYSSSDRFRFAFEWTGGTIFVSFSPTKISISLHLHQCSELDSDIFRKHPSMLLYRTI